jgi:hypothetical protein
MAKPILSDLDFSSVSKIVNLPDAIALQSPTTLAQVNALIEGLQDKGTAVCAASSNINLASPGAAIDGVTMSVGFVFLAKAQTNSFDCGTYIWNGASVVATRAANMNASAEFNNALVYVTGGTSAGITFRQTALNPTVGTTAIVFINFGTSVPVATTSSQGTVQIATQTIVDAGTDTAQSVSPATLKAASFLLKKYSTTFGDGSATQYDITHSLGTLDVHVDVQVVSTGMSVICDVTKLSTTVVRLNFSSAPASNALRCVVIG